jgi:hypothetical protein
MAAGVVLLSIPHLRSLDVTPGALASLDTLAGRGAMAELVPAFPSLAASSFATLVTGTGPYAHGMVGNAYFDRDRRRVMSSPLPDDAVLAPRLWDRLRAARPGARSLVWFAPNARGVAVDYAAWLDSARNLATQPAGLAEDLARRFGPLPCVRPGCAPLRLETSTWILRTAAAVIACERPELAVVRVPYLGQVARRFGPDGRDACRAVLELEAVLGPFLAALPRDALVLAATESITTPVLAPVYPNRVLRQLGLLALRPAPGGGLDIDLEKSAAFALTDHQITHIYLNDPSQEGTVAAAFVGEHSEGVGRVAARPQRASLGLDHPRAGDVVLVANPDRWFAPDWWRTAAEAPRDDASTCGLAVAATGHRPDPAHVKGSLGTLPPNSEYHGVLIGSDPALFDTNSRLAARDVAAIALRPLLLRAS